jgi:uncharacterized membrane protein
MTKGPTRGAGAESTTGLDANLGAMLAYAGFFLFSGLLFLAIEKKDRFVRFHALQSVLVAITLAVLYAFLGVVPLLHLLTPVVWMGSVVLWLLLMLKAYRGERYKLPLVGEIAARQTARR